MKPNFFITDFQLKDTEIKPGHGPIAGSIMIQNNSGKELTNAYVTLSSKAEISGHFQLAFNDTTPISAVPPLIYAQSEQKNKKNVKIENF